MSPPDRPLRRGWTTGACAAAAAKAAYTALLSGEFPDPVEVTLPKGERPAFALATARRHGAAAGPADPARRARDQPDAAPHDPRRAGRGRGRRASAGPRGRDRDSRG